MNSKRDKGHIFRIIFLGIITFIIWIPIIVTIFTSFKARSEIVTLTPSLFPRKFTFDNYIKLFNILDFKIYLRNSLIVATLTASISLFISSLAAYAIVWIRFRGKRAILNSILFVYMFPQILLSIPLFLMCHKLNLLDNKFVLVLIYLSFILPFAIWTLKGYFEAIPSELVDAGLIDGCNYFKCLTKIVLPVSLPAITTVSIYSFVLAWNEYLFANTLISSNSSRTISIGVQTLIGSHGTDFGLLTAASVIMIIPVILFFVLVQKYFMDGLTEGSIK